MTCLAPVRGRGMHKMQPSVEEPSFLDRLLSRAFGLLVGLGFGRSHSYLLQVRGRKSGRMYSTPVNVLLHRKRLYVVASRGQSQWVRNARTGGYVMLRKGRRCEAFPVRALPHEERAEILKAYVDRFGVAAQRYFPIPAGSSVEDFVPLARHYPVFELVQLPESQRQPPRSANRSRSQARRPAQRGRPSGNKERA